MPERGTQMVRWALLSLLVCPVAPLGADAIPKNLSGDLRALLTRPAAAARAFPVPQEEPVHRPGQPARDGRAGPGAHQDPAGRARSPGHSQGAARGARGSQGGRHQRQLPRGRDRGVRAGGAARRGGDREGRLVGGLGLAAGARGRRGDDPGHRPAPDRQAAAPGSTAPGSPSARSPTATTRTSPRDERFRRRRDRRPAARRPGARGLHGGTDEAARCSRSSTTSRPVRLGFATADTGEVGFANNIRSLAGCRARRTPCPASRPTSSSTTSSTSPSRSSRTASSRRRSTTWPRPGSRISPRPATGRLAGLRLALPPRPERPRRPREHQHQSRGHPARAVRGRLPQLRARGPAA